jgi:hypothetical protein
MGAGDYRGAGAIGGGLILGGSLSVAGKVGFETINVGSKIGANKLSVLQKADGVPNTGIASLDSPAIASSSFIQKIERMKAAGYEVTADRLLEARGQFSVGKKFSYNPETMTRLDMAHEWRHFNQLQQLEGRGVKLNRSAFGTMEAPGELGAFSYESRLWSRIGATPDSQYMNFHNAKIDLHTDQMSSFRSFAAKSYNAAWRGVNW